MVNGSEVAWFARETSLMRVSCCAMSSCEISPSAAKLKTGSRPGRVWSRPFVPGCRLALILLLWAMRLPAAEPGAAAGGMVIPGHAGFARYDVRELVVKSNPVVFSNAPTTVLTEFAGTNLPIERIIVAAGKVLAEYQQRGYATAYVSVAPELMRDGTLMLYVYKGASPQILVSGRPCLASGMTNLPAGFAAAALAAAAPTKAAPVQHFNVEAYEITGNTLLTTNRMMEIFARGVGTNVVLADIVAAAGDLQSEYRVRGYPTVSVTIPPQSITNAVVKIRVFEGRLYEILVTKNRYFSSNNVMRALPSLHTNMMLREQVFQAELDRANANQDRQIYPQLEPGPEPGTTILRLGVKDRLPLHAKVELNDQSTPGTPDLRVNTSAMYNNLWDREHSLGVQYSFAPEIYKQSGQVAFYDRPLVVNYGGFYRMPLGDFGAVEDQINQDTAKFGYDEATHKFNLPAPSGRPELNFFASRSFIDTGLLNLSTTQRYNTNGNTLVENDVQQDLTVNNGFGGRLSWPLLNTGRFQSGISGGFDYKTYQATSFKTNIFTLTSVIIDTVSNPAMPTTNVNVSVIDSPVPTTVHSLEYVPLAVRYDASLRDSRGVTAFGLGMSVNSWHSGDLARLRAISSSTESGGTWVIFTPSLIRTLNWRTNWDLTLRLDGQWSSEPLIANEEFVLGGLGTVRGYHEGTAFGDYGWHGSVEQKTPPVMIGTAYAGHPLVVRGTVYSDFGTVYLLDPQGRAPQTSLWGVGFGGVGTLGPNWEARLLFSWPLLDAGATKAGEPRFDFNLTAQF